MITHLQIFSILLVLSFGSSLQSQSLREIEFSVYGQYPVRGIEYTPVSPAAIEAGAEPEPPVSIETHSLARMGAHSFKGENQISFYDCASKELVAKVNLSTGSDKWLLIFVKNPRHKEQPSSTVKYLIYPFDDSRRNLPKNGLVFLNISGKELDGLLENKKVKLSAGESASYRVQESLPINLWSRDFSGERLLPALIKTYHFNPDHRYLMIFFPPVLRGSVDLDVRFLSESVE